MRISVGPAPLLLAAVLASPAPSSPDDGSEEAFSALARRAAVAREAMRIEEAIGLYGEAVALRPAWDEGHWYLGTLLYEAGRNPECTDAFARFLELKPAAGPGWVLRGLCEFGKGDHSTAAEHLEKGLGLGLGGNEELLRAARGRLPLALLKTGQFERAVEGFTHLARTSSEAPELVEAIGLLLLRTPALPSEVPDGRRALVREVGHAGYLHLALRGEEAAKAYAAVVAAHPDEPWVHYAYGVFLLRTDSDMAIAQLRRELEIQPDNVMAHLEIAFELIVRGEFARARPHAEKAVALAPSLFAARNALGRVLLETGEIREAIFHLEEAVRLAPESPEMHFALARAYTKAGRTEDAARARATFAELDRRRREQRRGAAEPRADGERP